MIFLKEYVHKCVRRDIDSYRNETNDNASERIGLFGHLLSVLEVTHVD